MCECKKVTMGGYENQITIPRPYWMITRDGDIVRDFISIDACLLSEVVSLWQKGITTTGCCCGHNLIEGYIGVHDQDIDRMLELGYEIAPNALCPDRRDSFFPKSIPRFTKNQNTKVHAL